MVLAMRVPMIGLVALLVSGSCASREESREGGEGVATLVQDSVATLGLAIRVIADSGRSQRLPVMPPPEARVWVSSVTPARAAPPAPPLPEPAADAPPPGMAPPPLTIDDDLKPPILRTPALLQLPATLRHREGQSVELDVRINEQGDVTDALWAGGSDDAPLVEAAIDCAMRMRFFAALRGETPVAVWCRQRFDFASR